MKKITLLFFAFLFSLTSYSQITEGFENTSGPTTLPNWDLGSGTWKVFDNGIGTGNSWTINALFHTGTNAAYINRDQNGAAGATSEDYLATPLVNIPLNGQLRFWSRTFTNNNQGTTYQVKIASGASDPTNPASYTILLQQFTEDQLTFDNATGTQNAFNVYTEHVLDVSFLTGQQVYIAFVKVFTQPTTAIGGDRWLLDDVNLVEQCLNPTNQAATPLATSSTLSWSGAGTSFEIENILQTATPTGVPNATSNSNSVEITGLTPNTQYCYYVRAICSEGNSSGWTGPFCYTTTSLPPVCGGNFVDSGGATGNYSNNENNTVTILPVNTGDQVTVTFTSFNTQAGNDILSVYDGSVISPTFLIGTYSGTTSPGSITSSAANGALTFVFTSNGTTTQAGWTSNITCGPAPACAKPTALITSAVLATSATLSWSQNPNPDTSVANQWEVIALPCGSATPTNSSAWIPANGVLTHNFTGLSSNTCYDLYVRAVCSTTLTSTPAGPKTITTTTLPPACGGNFVDSGGTTGAYQNNENITTTICAQNATDIVTVIFTSFSTESCCDHLSIYDGDSALSPFIGMYQGTISPGTVESSTPGGCLTFVWTSDGSVTSTGWIANVTCAPAPTCSKPTNVVVNSILSASANLSWNQPANPDTTTATAWQVLALPCGSPLPTATTPASGWVDTTNNTGFVYNNTLGGNTLNPDTCYTFYVRAVCSSTDSSPWSAGINATTQQIPPACGGIFTDTGGANGQYQNNENIITTICPDNLTDIVTVAFTSFATENCCDHLSIFDGPNTSSPFIGMYQGTVSPGTVESSTPGGCLTFLWTSDGSVLGNGWTANVTCAPAPTCSKPTNLAVSVILSDSATLNWDQPANPDTSIATAWQVLALPCGSALPTDTTPASGWVDTTDNTDFVLTGLNPDTCYTFYVRAVCSTTDSSPWSAGLNGTTQQIPPACGGIFSDTGGVSGQYQNNENITTTICPENPGEIVIVNFTSFQTENCCDHLSVFDGPNTSSPFIGMYQGTTIPSSFMATSPSGCLTFLWTSDGSVLGNGWSANVFCVTCPPPINLAFTDVNIYDVDLSWTNVGSASSWNVIALPCGSPAPNDSTTGWLTSDTTTFNYPNLDPSTCYDFYVRGVCSDTDNSNWTGPITTTTLPTCPQPINLIVNGTTTNSVTVSWTNQGPATLFEVVVQAVGSGIPTTTGIITSNTTLTISNLSQGFYEYYVRAVCSTTDQSLWSGPVNFYIPAILEACAGVNIELETSTPGVLNLCPGESCIDLAATFLDTGQTTTYDVDSIPFAPPFPFTGGTQTSVNIDDRWSNVIDLPFNFCFFGENQTKALVGSNGVITFDIQGFGGTQVPNGFCQWAFNQTIPNAAFPIKKAIYGPYQDIDPGVQNQFVDPDINYQILGEAPCRVFVVNFSEVAQFSGGCQTAAIGAQTSQIVLYETSNIIDVYVQRRVPCTSWQNGAGVIGIQNLAGTQAHVPPGRNTGSWSANNEAWRFTPAGPSNVTFSWLQDGEPFSTEQNINVCVTETTNMTAQAVYTACGGEQTVTTSTVLLQVLTELPVQESVSICTSYTLPQLTVGDYYTATGGPNGTGQLLNAGDQITSSQEIFVYANITSSTGTCSLENSFNVTILDELLPLFDSIPDLCLNSNPPSLQSTSNNEVTGFWTPSTIDTSVLGTTIYTFNPFGAASCAISTELPVTIVNPQTPEFDAIPDTCLNATLADLPLISNNQITGTWSPSATIDTSAQGTFTYTFTPDSTQSCTEQYTFDVTITDQVVPTFDPITLCQFSTDNALPLTSSNEIAGTWAVAAIDTSNFGTFEYIFTPDLNLSPCAVNGTLSVTIQELVTPSFDVNTTICQNSEVPSLSMVSNNLISGTWSPSTSIDTSTPGEFTYTFTPDSEFCASSYDLVITINEEVTPTFDFTTTLCQNSTNTSLPTISTNVNGIEGTWNVASIDTSTIGDTTYTFTPNAGFCATSVDVVVTITSEVTPTFAPITLCQFSTDNAFPTSSIAGTWAVATIDTSTFGTFQYTFIPDLNLSPCAVNGTLDVTIIEKVQSTFTALPAICQGDAIPSYPSISGEGTTGSWVGTFDSNAIGTQTITFVPDSGLCAFEGTLSLTVNAPTQATFNPLSVCQGEIPTLPSASLEGYTGIWDSFDTNTPGVININFTPDAGQCASVGTLSLTINAPVAATFETLTDVCQNDALPTLPTNSQQGFTGTWSGTFDTSLTGTQTITFIPDAGQCASNGTLSLTVNAPIQATFNPVAAVCQFDNAPVVTTTSLEGYTGSWSAIDTSTFGPQTITFTPNAGQCATATTMTITVIEKPVIDTVADIPGCDSATLPALTNGSYFAQSGGISPITDLNLTTSQTVYVYANNSGCISEDSFNVIITDSPIFTIDGNCDGGTYVLTATLSSTETGNVSYAWTNSSGQSVGTNSSTLDVTVAGNYSCTVTVDNNCSSDETFAANDIGCMIPNGISPNGDTLNDYFDLSGFNVKQLTIYNRYGTKVYSRGNYTNQWNGKSDNGNELPDGTYYYVIERTGEQTKTGWVYINREIN